MKVGILTFHWATNYGAVLQAYALQEYLTEQGHVVDIINYKPKQYDFSWKQLVLHPRLLLSFHRILVAQSKEQKIESFRLKYLNRTERIYTQDNAICIVKKYDVLISGSDQILNPFFTLRGEGRNTSIYYLNFPQLQCLKIGYAVSFGCIQYPKNAEITAKQYIQAFDSIGVREKTGIGILSQLGFSKKNTIVPDPTVLKGKSLFDKIEICDYFSQGDYVCVYMLRRKLNVTIPGKIIYIDELHESYAMEEWLGLIRHSKCLVTNSYHGMIMAILFHVPFVVDIEKGSEMGMNDRFYTILSYLGLMNRIVNGNFNELVENSDISWQVIDTKLESFRNLGVDFLNQIIYKE